MPNEKSRAPTTTRRSFLATTAAGLVGLPLALSSAGRAFAAETTVNFWSQFAGSKKVAGEGLEAAFKQAHPDVVVNTTLYAEPSQLNEKMLTAISGNTGPDLIVQHWDYNMLYAASDKLVSLSERLPADSQSRSGSLALGLWQIQRPTVLDADVWHVPWSRHQQEADLGSRAQSRRGAEETGPSCAIGPRPRPSGWMAACCSPPVSCSTATTSARSSCSPCSFRALAASFCPTICRA